ncbi:MAG: hypothetical protein H6644_13695 [Caldilineaceae bacterium]|nr:hypothetical protein [Caldilineaceae bacterium]
MLLYDVQVTPTLISPNADGDTDVTDIFYSLRRPATVSIYFDDAAGNRFLLSPGPATRQRRLQRAVGRRGR